VTARAAGATTRRAGLRRVASIRRVTDPSELRPRLEAVKPYAAYALAYLDPQLFHLADFFEATSGERTGLIMHARGGLGPSSLTLGDPSLVGALLRLHPGPRQTYLTCDPAHVDTLLKDYDLWRPQTMLRQRVLREDFAPPAGPLPVRRLIDADAGELNTLYAIEEEGLRYSGRQVSEGVYYGAHHRGRLVAAAGTHVYSPTEGVAVIGNVFTHPDFRGRGLATFTTAGVAAFVLKTCDLVVLNVDPANRTARHIYERLGFKETGRLVEAMATRRSAITPVPLLRRILARWRATTPYPEIVEM
jgi:RimJ/RimL family protein N-acetyltransferase